MAAGPILEADDAVEQGSRVDRHQRAAAADPKPRAALRPEIQALRAIAVLTVVVFHVWPSALPGGFVGVDVFFVISGYLITSLLLREIERTGALSLAQFWARRARRILPAALVTLLACALATIALAPLTDWQQFLTETRASAAYVQNWHLAGTAVDYFAADDSPSPVRHFWSLSVEEQFYLVWPVLMIVALVVTRPLRWRVRRSSIAIAMGALTAISLAYSLYRTAASPAPAYFETPTRAWEFGVGGLLALAPRPNGFGGVGRAALSWLGIGAILLAACIYSAETPFPGYAALLPVLGALAVMHAGAPARRWAPTPALRLRPVQLIGDISYSVYLWHWPLIIFLPLVVDLEPVPTGITVFVLTIVLGWLSKRFVEDPIRASRFLSQRRTGWTFLFAGIGTAGVIAVTAVGIAHVRTEIRKDEQVTRRTLATKPSCFGAAARNPEQSCENPRLRLSVVPSPVEAPKLPNSPCEVVEKLGRVRACASGAPAAQAKATVALIGDSHASHWRAALDVVTASKRWRSISITHTSCPFSQAVPKIVEPDRTECIEWNRDTLRWLERHPEVSTAFVVQHTGGEVVGASPSDNFAAQAAGYAAAWEALPASVKHVIVIRDTPKSRSETLACVEQAIADDEPAGRRCAVPRSFALERDPAIVAAQRLRSERVQTIDLTPFLCDARLCYPVVGGALVYKDIHHLTAVFAESLGPFLRQRVDRLMASWR